MTNKSRPEHWKSQTIQTEHLVGFVDIPRTGGIYKINDSGTVVSGRRRELPDGWWIVLKPRKCGGARPFRRVSIHYDEGKRECQVSRLILESFEGPPPTAMHLAAHRNGDTLDDRRDNLVWALPADVAAGRICRGTWAHGEKVGTAKFAKEQVEAARRIVIDHGVSVNLLATAIGITQPRVREWLVMDSWNSDKWDGLANPLYPDSSVTRTDTGHRES